MFSGFLTELQNVELTFNFDFLHQNFESLKKTEWFQSFFKNTAQFTLFCQLFKVTDTVSQCESSKSKGLDHPLVAGSRKARNPPNWDVGQTNANMNIYFSKQIFHLKKLADDGWEIIVGAC